MLFRSVRAEALEGGIIPFCPSMAAWALEPSRSTSSNLESTDKEERNESALGSSPDGDVSHSLSTPGMAMPSIVLVLSVVMTICKHNRASWSNGQHRRAKLAGVQHIPIFAGFAHNLTACLRHDVRRG